MLKDMKSYAHLKPGQKGTMRLVEKYGKALLCVRYRYDEVRDMKLKTVEIIVDEKPVQGPRFKDDDMVPVSVAFDETELSELLKRMRARWEPQIKMWFAPYRLIRGTPLEDRIAVVYPIEKKTGTASIQPKKRRTKKWRLIQHQLPRSLLLGLLSEALFSEH
jgi:hypothetical protein